MSTFAVLVLAVGLFSSQAAEETIQYRVETLAGKDIRKLRRDGPFKKAAFFSPSQLVLAPDRTLYVLDVGVIRALTPDGQVVTPFRSDSPSFWRSFAIDPKGTLYVGTKDEGLWQWKGEELIEVSGGEGYRDGLLSQALFAEVGGLAVDSEGNIFVSDTGNCRIRRIGADGHVTTVAGSPALISTRFHRDDNDSFEDLIDILLTIAEGTPLNKYQKRDLDAFLAGPLGPEIEDLIPVFKQRGMDLPLREVQRLVEPLTFRDGPATTARFFEPKGITLDRNGHILVADYLNHRIRSVAPTAGVRTVAGGQLGYRDGPARQAQFNMPEGIATDTKGNIFVADTGNHCIRMISPTGQVTTLAGGASRGDQDGIGSQARLTAPVGITVKEDGTIFISENRTIRVLIPAGEDSGPNLPAPASEGWPSETSVIETDSFYYRLGISPQSLIAAVGDDYLVSGKGRITYWRTVYGYDARVSYHFSGWGRLNKVVVSFGSAISTDADWVKRYRSIRAQVTKTYGKPRDDGAQWYDDTYENQPDHLGRAVRLGHVGLWTGWRKGIHQVSISETFFPVISLTVRPVWKAKY